MLLNYSSPVRVLKAFQRGSVFPLAIQHHVICARTINSRTCCLSLHRFVADADAPGQERVTAVAAVSGWHQDPLITAGYGVPLCSQCVRPLFAINRIMMVSHYYLQQ